MARRLLLVHGVRRPSERSVREFRQRNKEAAMSKTDPTAPRNAIPADPASPSDAMPRSAAAIAEPETPQRPLQADVLLAGLLGFALGFVTALAFGRREDR